MTAARRLTPFLWAVSALVVLVPLTGCGGSEGRNPDDYPLVEPAAPQMQPPVTMPNGAVVTLPALPTTLEVEPSPTCEREVATFHDGSLPTQRPVVIPPAPGLRATAVTEHTTSLTWSFRDLPADCRPVLVLLSVRNGTDPSATPTTERVAVTGVTGSVDVTYPEFLPAPDVASASAFSQSGHRSRTVSVLVDRSGSVPPDPPAPPRPVTAPAGAPASCRGRPTVVEDPTGDVLTYGPGSPPRLVSRMTRALSGIDIETASVRIEGRKLCATFTFARPPGDTDFQVRLNLHDTTTSRCCASLLFRRSAGQLEVGFPSADSPDLQPVSAAGAALVGSTLTVTGTLPPAGAWEYGSHRLPRTANLGWSATTGYFPERYGPAFGDWLPRHEAVGQPAIRHRDGAVVRPGLPRRRQSQP